MGPLVDHRLPTRIAAGQRTAQNSLSISFMGARRGDDTRTTAVRLSSCARPAAISRFVLLGLLTMFLGVVIGGRGRATLLGLRPFEKPLTTRDCADFMGRSTKWIRRAIVDGVTTADGRTVKAAQTLEISSRTTYRIPADRFRDFLLALGCRHLPARAAELPAARPMMNGAQARPS